MFNKLETQITYLLPKIFKRPKCFLKYSKNIIVTKTKCKNLRGNMHAFLLGWLDYHRVKPKEIGHKIVILTCREPITNFLNQTNTRQIYLFDENKYTRMFLFRAKNTRNVYLLNSDYKTCHFQTHHPSQGRYFLHSLIWHKLKNTYIEILYIYI
jgi:hypothetical protein